MRLILVSLVLAGLVVGAQSNAAHSSDFPPQIGTYCMYGGGGGPIKGETIAFYFNSGTGAQYSITTKDDKQFVLKSLSDGKVLKRGGKGEVINFFKASKHCQSPTP